MLAPPDRQRLGDEAARQEDAARGQGAARDGDPPRDEDGAVWRAVLEAARAGRRVALATVVRARGSTPRRAGSKMVIDPGAGLVGTIGGGCGEAEVLAAAAEVVRSGVPRLVRVALTDPEESWSPAVCGGVMDVLVEPVLPGPTPEEGDDGARAGVR